MHIQALSDTDIDGQLPMLNALLIQNVADGASIGFHAPLSDADAEQYWRGVQSAVRRGERVLLVAYEDERTLIGSGQLGLESRVNGRHRAELQKLIVAPSARRRGVARALMQALEAAAMAAERTLLVLDTREGDAAADLYHALGWHFVGRVPGYVLEEDGSTSATLIFCKSLDR